MIHKKKRWVVLLLALLVLAIQIPANAANVFTAAEKAEALGRINILKGSNGDYRLNDQISRSEAAAFIVRLLGKEDYVLANADLFRKTNFTDVPETSWFAPYVGYLTSLGYIAGVTTNSFQPNAFITEKAFIKITLCALNYIPEVDFKWDGIYRKAVEVGLVTDVYYIVRTEDNTNYTRGQAVEVLYNALTLPLKGTDIKLFQQLIQDGLLSNDDALIAGFVYDTIRTDILEVLSVEMDRVTVKFNEAVKKIGDVYIYRSSSPDDKQLCTVLSQGSNELVVKTIPQIALRDYTIEVLSITDAEGNTIDSVKKSFYGFLTEKVTSTFFRISAIEPENSKAINVIFTHPVNKNTEISLYYKIYEDNRLFADGTKGELTVKQLGKGQNSVLLTLVNKSFNPQCTYSLEIDGELLSAYGAPINNGSSDMMKFIPGEGAAEAFQLTGITTLDSETIEVSFNKEINPFIAEQIYNFYVTDEKGKPVQIEKTVVSEAPRQAGKVIVIKLYGSMEKDKAYQLTINNLNDITRQEYISEQVYSFTSSFGINEGLILGAIRYPDKQTVELIFNRPLDKKTASDASLYGIRNKTDGTVYRPVKVYIDSQNPEKVKLYFKRTDALVDGKPYELQLNELLKDYTGKALGKLYRLDFYAEAYQSPSPLTCIDISPISSDAIKITLNKEFLLDEDAIRPENYILEYYYQAMKIEKNPTSILYVDDKTLILKFDAIGYGIDYVLRMTSLKDFAEFETSSLPAINFNFDAKNYSTN